MEDERWWSVFGRLAAPTFFFLLGYAQTRTVPLNWIWLGVILTLLESWNAGWTWVAPNILLSLALIRIARPYAQILVQHHWAAFALLVSALLARAADSCQDCRLRRGGMAVGAVRLIPTHVCRRQISCRRGRCSPKLSTVRDAMTGNANQMRLLAALSPWSSRLAGTKGILVSSDPFRRLHSWRRRFVRQPVSVPTRPEPHPTARSRSRRLALHRSAHFGNLRHPACWLRTPCKVGARSRALTREFKGLGQLNTIAVKYFMSGPPRNCRWACPLETIESDTQHFGLLLRTCVRL